MEHELSILQLMTHASIVVKIVITILLLFSLTSWYIIINKWLSLIRVNYQMKNFLIKYHQSNNISTLYTLIGNIPHKNTVVKMFFNGLNEYNLLYKQNVKQVSIILENLERKLLSTIDSEMNTHEMNLSTLATFGSVSPYIGLLGTVWGIMKAFIGIGASNQATLSAVAPGIAEALVTTAIGLFVAIPSYIFYNKFIANVNTLNNQMNIFGDDFLNVMNRRLIKNTSPTGNDDDKC